MLSQRAALAIATAAPVFALSSASAQWCFQTAASALEGPPAARRLQIDWSNRRVIAGHNCYSYAFNGLNTRGRNWLHVPWGEQPEFGKGVPVLGPGSPLNASHPDRLTQNVIGTEHNDLWLLRQTYSNSQNDFGRRWINPLNYWISMPTESELNGHLVSMSTALIQDVQRRGARFAGVRSVEFAGRTLPSFPTGSSDEGPRVVAAYVGWLPVDQFGVGPTGYNASLLGRFVQWHRPDFHFARRNRDGTWSDKPGSESVRNLSSEFDRRVIDEFDRLSPSTKMSYDYFVGYFILHPRCFPDDAYERPVGTDSQPASQALDAVYAKAFGQVNSIPPADAANLDSDLRLVHQLLSLEAPSTPGDEEDSYSWFAAPTALLPTASVWSSFDNVRVSADLEKARIDRWNDFGGETSTVWTTSSPALKAAVASLGGQTVPRRTGDESRHPTSTVDLCDALRVLELAADDSAAACTIVTTVSPSPRRSVAILNRDGAEWADSGIRVEGPTVSSQVGSWANHLAVVGDTLFVDRGASVDLYQISDPSAAPTSIDVPAAVSDIVRISAAEVAIGYGNTALSGVALLTESGGSWSITSTVAAPPGLSGSFGRSIAISPSEQLVAVAAEDGVALFGRSTGAWQARSVVPIPTMTGSETSGQSMAFGSESMLLVGAPDLSAGSEARMGLVYELREEDGFWNLAGTLESVRATRNFRYGATVVGHHDFVLVGNSPVIPFANDDFFAWLVDRTAQLHVHTDDGRMRELTPGYPVVEQYWGDAVASVGDGLLVAESIGGDPEAYFGEIDTCARVHVFNAVPDLDGDGVIDVGSPYDEDGDGGVDAKFRKPDLATSRTATWPRALSSSDPYVDGYAAGLVLGSNGQGQVMAIWRSEHEVPCGPDSDIFFATSNDDGLTWLPGRPLHADAFGDDWRDSSPAVSVGPEGQAIVAWRRSLDEGSQVLVSQTADFGETWTEPFAVSGAPSSVGTVRAGYNPPADSWLVSWAESNTTAYVCASTDGVTWGSPEVVPMAADAAAVQSVSHGASGRWLLGTEARGTTIGGSDYDVFAVTANATGPRDWSIEAINSDAPVDDRHDRGGVQLLELSDRTLFAAWKPGSGDMPITMTRKPAGSQSWQPLTQVPALDSLFPPTVLELHDGSVFVTVASRSESVGGLGTVGADWDIFAIVSDDQGSTWGSPMAMNATVYLDNASGANDYFSKAVATGSSGALVGYRTEFEFDGAVSAGSDVVFTRYFPEGSCASICPCSAADVSAPWGQLDIDDVLTFLTGFDQEQWTADVAPPGAPDGLLNIDDVLYFLQSFDAGCP